MPRSRAEWKIRVGALPGNEQRNLARTLAGDLPPGWQTGLAELKRKISEEGPKLATRVASQKALEVLTQAIPELVGGSADLTGSNNTRAGDQAAINKDTFAGSYVHYGVREHAMAAVMNGIALHGGLVPYGGSFLVFSDYCRPSIRMSALMRLRVIYVMTHDSIGLGEDGPTHQPVEHLASLRLIPGVTVYRPADAVETAECWALALEDTAGPSVLALSRQGLPTVRREHRDENLSASGGYVLQEASGLRKVTLLATGSEVALALEACEMLEADNIPTAVVSMPSTELFDAREDDYRAAVLPAQAVTVAIEASAASAWERYVGPSGGVVGMKGFGASGPAPDLYEHFGITARAAADLARELLARKEAEG